MKRDLNQPITSRPANENSPRLADADIVARADRMAGELAALAGSPGERALLARIATQAIVRGLGGVQP